jgi:hypothetical protein
MSGGSFNYAYSRVQDFADELALKIEGNDVRDVWGDAHCFPSRVIAELSKLATDARAIADRMRAAEWLYSHDIGDETFLRWIDSPYAAADVDQLPPSERPPSPDLLAALAADEGR